MPPNPKIAISAFCKTRDLSKTSLTEEEILQRVEENFLNAIPGYRPGVLLVAINPQGFSGQIRTLLEGDALTGTFKPRVPGELPRKEIRCVYAEADKPTAVDVVLYSKETLAENKENSDPTADYEVIALLAKIAPGAQPMPPETLMANHFRFEGNGGTATNMTPEEFEKALRESYLFWQNKTIVA